MKNYIFILVLFMGVSLSIYPIDESLDLDTQNEVVETKESYIFNDIKDLANANGFNPTKRVIDSIVRASNEYGIDALELTAIGIIETGLGKYVKTMKNKNGTHDRGVFQINTINESKCVEYNLDSPEGSALCAAKLLSEIRSKRKDYLGVYHSKTPSKKEKYLKKITKVFEATTDK